jgi:hypothetical protein
MTITYYIAKPSVIGFEVEMVLDKDTGKLASVYLVGVDSSNRFSENILTKLGPIIINNLTNCCAITDELEREWIASNKVEVL